MPARLTVADAAVALHADWGAFQRDVDTQGTAQAKTAGQKITAALGPTAITKAFTVAGAAGTALFTGAIGGAVNFEDQLRTINTVAHLTDGELKGVGSSILDLSKETGKSTDDLTAGFYDLVSAGVPAKDAINVLRDSAKFATGALGSTGEAVDLVTSAMNAYGLQAKDSTKITDVFAQAVADGKVTAAELGTSIANIAPIASSAGISLQEVAAGYAVLTAKGVPAAQAATEMRAAISALLTPNSQLNDLQKQTGINFAELAKQKGLAVALEAIRKATNGDNDAFAKSLGSIEAYQFALASTGDSAAAYQAELGKTSDALSTGGVAQGQYDERMKSAKLQGDKMLASIHALAIEIGGPFTAVLGPAVAVVGQLGQGLQGLFLVSSGLGGLLGRVLGGAWSKVAGNAAVTSLIRFAGGKAATVYLTALIAGDGIAVALKGAWTAVTSSSLVTGAVSKAGSFLGSSLGTFAAVALAAVLVVKAIETYNDIKDRLAAQGADIGKHVGEEIATGTVDSLEESKGALQKGIADLADVHDFGIFSNDARANLQKQLDDVNAALAARAAAGANKIGSEWYAASEKAANRIADATPHLVEASANSGEKAGDAMVAGWRASVKPVGAVVSSVVSSSIAAHVDWIKVAHAQGNRAGAATAQGIHDARSLVDQAWQSLLDAIKNAQTPAQERARLLGELASKELVKGLHSGDPAVRAQAAATKQIIIDRLTELSANTKNIGKKGMEELRKAMRSKDPDIRAAALAIYNSATGKLTKIPAAGTKSGKDTATNLTSQLNAGSGKVGTAAANLAAVVARNIFTRILHDGQGIARSGGPAVGYAVGSPYIPYDQVALIHKGERILTAEQNAAVSSGQATLAAPGGEPPQAAGPLIGELHVHPGKDTSLEQARRFGQSVLDEVATGLREQGRRRGIHAAVIP